MCRRSSDVRSTVPYFLGELRHRFSTQAVHGASADPELDRNIFTAYALEKVSSDDSRMSAGQIVDGVTHLRVLLFDDESVLWRRSWRGVFGGFFFELVTCDGGALRRQEALAAATFSELAERGPSKALSGIGFESVMRIVSFDDGQDLRDEQGSKLVLVEFGSHPSRHLVGDLLGDL